MSDCNEILNASRKRLDLNTQIILRWSDKRCLCSSRLKFSREKRAKFNNFRYSVRFLDSYEMLVNTIDILSNWNEYNTMLPVRNRFPNCDFRGGQISQPLVLWLIYIYIWVLASTLAHSASEINKALSVTYKLLFIVSKNIVPSRSYRYIRDRAFPVTACHPLYIQSLM